MISQNHFDAISFLNDKSFRNELAVTWLFRKIKIWKTENENENENRNETGEDTYAGALRAPRAGSPAFVSVFVFVLIFGFSNFDFSK